MEITLLKTYKHKSGSIYQVIAADLDTISFAPVGGGFVSSATTDNFYKSFEPFEIPDELKQGIFSIDGCEPLIGWSNPLKKWNGWAMPYIHLDDLLKLTGLTKSALLVTEEGYIVTHESFNGVSFIPCSIDGLDDFYMTDGWCWDDDTPENEAERIEILSKLKRQKKDSD